MRKITIHIRLKNFSSPGKVALYKRMGSARLCWSWSSCWPSWSSGWSSSSQSGGSADVKSRWKLTFSIFLSLSIYLSKFSSIYLFIDPYFFCLSIFIFLISPWNKTLPAVPIHSVNFPFQLTDIFNSFGVKQITAHLSWFRQRRINNNKK